MAKKVMFLLGAGAGIGGTVAQKFASEGYHAVLARRSDQEGLDKLVAGIKESGGSASGMLLDATKPDTIENAIKDIEDGYGPIEVALFNLGAQVGDRPLEETSHKTFELGWRMAVFRPVSPCQSAVSAHGRARRRYAAGNFGDFSHARQRRAALARRRYGRSTYAVPVAQRTVRTARNTCGACSGRRLGGCAGHARQTAGRQVRRISRKKDCRRRFDFARACR